MKIDVNNKDLGFFTQEPITVQSITREGEVLFCNHAGAGEQDLISEMYNPVTEEHKQWTTSVLVCDKCGAVKRKYEDWEQVDV